MVGVQHAVQNGIENLSGTSITSNEHPGQGYLFRARTREELLQSQHLVADAGGVRAGRAALDPAAEQLAAPRWADEDQTRLIVPESQPPKAPPPQQDGWLL